MKTVLQLTIILRDKEHNEFSGNENFKTRGKSSSEMVKRAGEKSASLRIPGAKRMECCGPKSKKGSEC